MKITKPALIVDKERAVRNIERMAAKIRRSPGNIRFRPHFKTHQSAIVGQWFREQGVTSVTVSSVDMACYFSQNGWNDITIAVLVNPLEIDTVDRLAQTANLGLLIDSPNMAAFLQQKLNHPVNLWIKIDTGYHRTGIPWDQKDDILIAADGINRASKLQLKGLLTHSGHSYQARSTAQLKEIYADTVGKMNDIRGYLKENGVSNMEISIGDTPTCSAVDEFYGIDEVRCGNFVFYDLMQLAVGACKEEDIAAAAACPVIGRYPRRNEIVIYGGAVHLSKDFLTDAGGQKIFGRAALPDAAHRHWGPMIENTFVASLSQEHGIIKTTPEFIDRVQVGDVLMILPVHSCLAANLLKYAPDGQEPF